MSLFQATKHLNNSHKVKNEMQDTYLLLFELFCYVILVSIVWNILSILLFCSLKRAYPGNLHVICPYSILFNLLWVWISVKVIYIYIYPYPFRMRVDSVYCFWCEVVSLVCISGVAEKKPVVQRKSDVDEGRTLFVRSVSHSLWAVKRAAHSSLSDVSVSVIYRTSVLDTWMKVLSLYWLFTFLARAKYIIHAFRIFGRTGKLLHNVGK